MANPAAAKSTRRSLPGGRWWSVIFRAIHLLGVVWLGAAVHGAPIDARSAGVFVLASGAVLFALDLWSNREHLREIAGLSVLFKLLLVAGIVTIDAARLPLFWLVVLWSAVFSHAPGNLRHRRPFGPGA